MSYATEANVEALLGGTYAGIPDISTRFPVLVVIVDAWVDSKIASVATLPLVTVPAAVGLAADYRACYETLRGVFTEAESNKSAWVDSFLDRADETMADILANPNAIFGSQASPDTAICADSSTLNDDKEFTIGRKQNGVPVEGGTMDVW